MPFGGPKIPEGAPTHHDAKPQGEPREQTPLDTGKFLVRNSVETPEKRAERRRDEAVWRRLQRADVALRVESYFRSGPQNPSLSDMLSSIDLPAGTVDRNFLRACGVVAERFRQQSEDARSVMDELTKSVRRQGLRPSAANLGQELYKDMVHRFAQVQRAEDLQLTRVHGFLFMSVNDENSYNDIYNERTPDERSGGRFHRAQMVNIANRQVPLVTRRGALQGNVENDAIMIHEIQHWINEGLVSLTDMETPRPSMLRLPAHERRAILEQEKRRRVIKDEVLAYLREGRIRDVNATLQGKLYEHLFEGKSSESGADRLLVSQISLALAACIPFIEKYPRLKDRMVYALIDVPLESMSMHINAIRGLYERMDSLLEDETQLLDVDILNVRVVPQKYAEDLQTFFTLHEDVYAKCGQMYDVLRGTNESSTGEDDTSEDDAPKKIHELRQAFRRGAASARRAYGRLRPEGRFIPYVSNIECRDIETLDEYSEENNVIRNVLDVVGEFSSRDIDVLCEYYGTRGFEDDRRRIATSFLDAVKAVLQNRYGFEPNVSLVASARGIQMSVGYVRHGKNGDSFVHAFVNIPQSQDATSSSPMPTPPTESMLSCGTEFFDESILDEYTEHIPYPCPKQFRKEYQELREARDAYSELRDVVRHARTVGKPGAARTKRLQFHQKRLHETRRAFERAKEGLYIDNAHIPVVYDWDIPELAWPKEISIPVQEAQEKLSIVLFGAAQRIPQDSIDGWVDEGEVDEDSWERHAAIQQELLGSIGSTFGSGKIRNIAFQRVEFRKDSFAVVLEAQIQERHGGWLYGRITIVLHRRRRVAAPADSR